MPEAERTMAENLNWKISGFVHELARVIERQEYATLTVSPTLNGCTISVEYPEPPLVPPAVRVDDEPRQED